jgi:hypothetical protein
MQHPGITKGDLRAWCRDAGLQPRQYRLRFSHNNFNRTSSWVIVRSAPRTRKELWMTS